MTPRIAGILAIVVTSVLWGTTGTAATFAPGVGPLAIGAAALGIGGILQALVALRPLRRALPQLRTHLGLLAVGALSVAVYPLAFYSSMHLAGVAVGTVVSLASAPLISGVLELVIDRRPLGRPWMLAAGLAIAGCLALCLARESGGSDGTAEVVLGVLLGLVAGATYALYSWVVRRLLDAGVERAAGMGAVFGLGGVLLMPVLAVTGAPLLASAQNAAVGAYMALVPMFLGYVLFGYGLARVPASSATTITLLEPAVATVLAVAVVGERIGPLGWIGLVAIATGLAVLVLAPDRSALPVRAARPARRARRARPRR